MNEQVLLKTLAGFDQRITDVEIEAGATRQASSQWSKYLLLTGGIITGSFEIAGANGINFNPVGDVDIDILSLDVTGTPTLSWNELSDMFSFNKPVYSTSSIITAGGQGFLANAIGITFGANALAIKANNADGHYFIFQARDTGVGLVEVARIQGAADPYICFGGSQEFVFYNSGSFHIKAAGIFRILDTGALQAGSDDDDYFTLMAKDNGVGMVEVARIVGGAEPHFMATRGLIIPESAGQWGTVAGYGGFWVRNNAPCQPMFTDDDGDDHELHREIQSDHAQITAHANDLAIDTAASFIRLTNDGAYNITGIVAGIPAKKIWIVNASAGALTFTNEDANSVAANRLLIAGGDHAVAQNEMIMFIYDATSARWRSGNN